MSDPLLNKCHSSSDARHHYMSLLKEDKYLKKKWLRKLTREGWKVCRDCRAWRRKDKWIQEE